MSGHLPVMLNEVVAALQPRDGECHIDGTFGGGGYARALLDAADCVLLGIDRDPDAIARGRELAAHYPGRLRLAHGPFSEMDVLAREAGFAQVDGVVLDLGVSSFQFDQPERGFSFRADGPLDMRMSREGPSAADVVNGAEEGALARIIAEYGEERAARRIARAIVQARPIHGTAALAQLIADVLGPKARALPIHPATRTFQALRIHVNDELGELTRALEAATRILAPEGRLCVVAFHSLEDRIVKRFLAARSEGRSQGSRHMPQAPAEAPQYRLLTRHTQTPLDTEIAANPRARSARLRAAVRLAA